MSDCEPSKADNGEEVSPEFAVAIRKARRAFALSFGLLLLGLVAIGFAVMYRANKGEETPEAEYSAGVLAVPANADVVSAVPADGLFAVTYTLGGRTHLRLIDGQTGTVLRDIEFVRE